MVTLGCAYVAENECWIILAPDDVIKAQGYTTAMVKRHEEGHCNSWPRDHRGARVPTASDWK
jgi:hypothetical protein